MPRSLFATYGARIAARQMGCYCVYCYKPLNPEHSALVYLKMTLIRLRHPYERAVFYDDAPVIDHVVPMALGGPTHIDNLVIACRRCNARKGSRSLTGS